MPTDPSSSGSELERCPFCGGAPLPAAQILAGDGDRWQIWSVCCGLECGRGPQRGNAAEAIAAWNRRTVSSQGVEELRDKLGAAIENLGETASVLGGDEYRVPVSALNGVIFACRDYTRALRQQIGGSPE